MKSTLLISVVMAVTLPWVQSATVANESCTYNGRTYPIGGFNPNPCLICHCHGPDVGCTDVPCHPACCVDPVDHGDDPAQCCPVCPNGCNCKAPDGTIIPHGQVDRKGSTTCRCEPGRTEAQCEIRRPIQVTH